MENHKLEITNDKGYRLNAFLELPPNRRPAYFAIFAHCFTCNNNLNAVRHISTALTVHGVGVVRFDFTGLGKSEGTFAESHFSSNVADLVAVYRYMDSHFEAPALMVGHSLGGAAVLAAADRLPALKAVATIGAPSSIDHVKKHFDLIKGEENGDADYEVHIGGRPFLINNTFLEEMEKTDLLAIVKRLHKPVLFLHSPGDQIVGIENAQHLYEHAVHPKSFVSLDHADHLLSKKADSIYTADMIAAWSARYMPVEENIMLNNYGEQIVAYLDLGQSKFTTNLQTPRHAFIADEPLEAGGENMGPSPYDYLSAALAACTTMTVRLYAERKAWDLQEVFVYITYTHKHEDDMKDGTITPGHLEVFSKKLRFVGNLDEVQKERLKEIAAKCPVHQTLSLPAHIETSLID